MFISNAIIKSTLVGTLAIPVLFIFPIISPLIITLAITIYFKETQGVQERIKEKRSRIEQELPTIVFNIEKTLTHSRDVLSILESYKRNAGPVMKNELSITIADMRSGNYELALTRFEARVGSSMLSDVTRGLVSILRGDETGMYWTSLSLKLADSQRQLLKREAMKVPGRIKRLSMVLLFMFMATYIVIIGIEVMSSLGAILG
jgi:tight adherence protein C